MSSMGPSGAMTPAATSCVCQESRNPLAYRTAVVGGGVVGEATETGGTVVRVEPS